MINFLLSFLVLATSFNPNVDSFEGSIQLVHESYYDTYYFSYFVKKDKVRIDKFDSNEILLRSLLIDLESKEVFALCPKRKLYKKLEVNSNSRSGSENYSILKTENSRMFGEYKCYQWRVRNKERNTEIAYWVAQNDFYFFEELVKLINSADHTYEFFEKIPETQGFFPMLSVERTLLRKEKSRTYVVEINNKKMNKELFLIPANYELTLH